MLRALALLLFVLHCRSAAAVRPTHKNELSGGANDTEVLAIGDLATLQHRDQPKRQQHSSPLDLKGLALTELTRSDNKPLALPTAKAPEVAAPEVAMEEHQDEAPESTGSSSGEEEYTLAPQKAAEVPVEKKEKDQGANGTAAAPAPANVTDKKQGANLTSSEPTQANLNLTAKKPGDLSQGQVLVIPEIHPVNPVAPYTGEQNKKKRVFKKFAEVAQYARPVRNPLSELLHDEEVQEGFVRKDDQKRKNEAIQELDDLIDDATEVGRVTGRAGYRAYRFALKQRTRHITINVLMYLITLFLGLGLYFMWFQHMNVPRDEDFRYGICECLGDFRICACGFFCPAIRWADTVSGEKGGYLGFIPALLTLLVLMSLCWYPCTGFFAWIAITIVGVHYRQKIREKSGLQSGTPATMIQDFATWLCCGWCAIIQEARQVDELTYLTESELDSSNDSKEGSVDDIMAEKLKFHGTDTCRTTHW